jgi:stage II sporulation SpoE-like protein
MSPQPCIHGYAEADTHVCGGRTSAAADVGRGVAECARRDGKRIISRQVRICDPLVSRSSAGPGDRGLLYTDGVSETNNPEDAEFGSERFRQFLEPEKNGSANQFADRLLEELARWSARREGEDLDDDITMVTIRVTDTA